MLSVLYDMFKFMRVYRKFWMFPFVFGLLALGMLLTAIQGSAISPFLYAIF